MRKLVLGIIIASGAGVGADSTSGLDRIVDEGLRHSQVMQTAEYLDDRIGGRLTNSPAMRTR